MPANPNNWWIDHDTGVIRHEAHYGTRLVRCLPDRPASIDAMLAEATRRFGDREALIADGRRWTYRQLDQEVTQVARGLASLGFTAGDRVALFMGNNAAFVLTLFALQRLSVITVPIGIREQRAGLAYMLNQCGAKGIVFDEDLRERIPDEAQAPTITHRLVPGSAEWLALMSLAATGSAATDATGNSGAGNSDAGNSDAGNSDAGDSDAGDSDAGDIGAGNLGAGNLGPGNFGAGNLGAGNLGAENPGAENIAAEDATACILYTSGTTGRPKGAMLTHLSFAHSVRHFEICFKLTHEDCAVLSVPGSHVTGLVALILSMVHVGGRLIVMPEFKAPKFLALAAAERATFTVMVPAMYQLCLMQPDFSSYDLSAWRIAGYGGAPMPASSVAQLAKRLPGLILGNAYGSTETTSPVTIMPLGRGRERADSVGVAAPCADIVVVDEAGREVPRGQTGELWIGGPMVVPGYWDNPVATAESFTSGYWHSGDVGSIDDEGFVRLFDRTKDMLNRGGFKIYSVEVENTLVGVDGVVEAAVVGKPCPVLGERVHAFVYAQGETPDVAKLRAHCAAMLADYKVPESIVVSQTPLPRNANGKLMKRLMRDQLMTAG